MLLTIDIGNTNIKTALSDNGQLFSFRVHSNPGKIIDYINDTSFDSAAICSVSPLKYDSLKEKFESMSIPIFFADINQKLNLKIDYDTPQTIGMDRVCSAVGALKIAEEKSLIDENQYLMTIDFGTATTINVVSPRKEFIGGLIAPGVSTMFRSLNEQTAQLPLSNENFYKELIGKSTEASIVSGVINSTIGMINETVNHLMFHSNSQPIIFITGGNARIISPYLKNEVLFEEALVLKGLKFIYNLNTGDNS